MSILRQLFRFLRGKEVTAHVSIDVTPEDKDFTPSEAERRKMERDRAKAARKRRRKFGMRLVPLLFALSACPGCLVMRTHAETPEGIEVSNWRVGLLYGFGRNQADAALETGGVKLEIRDQSNGAEPDSEALEAIARGSVLGVHEAIRRYYGPFTP